MKIEFDMKVPRENKQLIRFSYKKNSFLASSTSHSNYEILSNDTNLFLCRQLIIKVK
jgi:hypothetical protein